MSLARTWRVEYRPLRSGHRRRKRCVPPVSRSDTRQRSRRSRGSSRRSRVESKRRKSSDVIRIGTRASELALRQARLVERALLERGFKSELVTFKTTGDKKLDQPLSEIGA